jgi:hypothetical protein
MILLLACATLRDILDPSRPLSPDFINYTPVTTDGKLGEDVKLPFVEP